MREERRGPDGRERAPPLQVTSLAPPPNSASGGRCAPVRTGTRVGRACDCGAQGAARSADTPRRPHPPPRSLDPGALPPLTPQRRRGLGSRFQGGRTAGWQLCPERPRRGPGCGRARAAPAAASHVFATCGPASRARVRQVVLEASGAFPRLPPACDAAAPTRVRRGRASPRCGASEAPSADPSPLTLVPPPPSRTQSRGPRTDAQPPRALSNLQGWGRLTGGAAVPVGGGGRMSSSATAA